MKKQPGITLLALLIGILLVAHAASSSLAAPPAQLTPFPTPTPGPDGRIVYIVKSGDSLWRISSVTGIPIDEIRALNNMSAADVIQPGQELLLGLGGPASGQATPAPRATPTASLPSPTPGIGTGVLCVLLYEDINGDAIRQENEPSLPGGAISVNDRFGAVSLTADTPAGGISDDLFPEPEELGFTCFKDLEQGDYNVTAAIPEGYNPTTRLNYALTLNAGEELFLDFGAQPNTQTLIQAPAPEGTGPSRLLGALGGLFLLLGAGLGVYAFLKRK